MALLAPPAHIPPERLFRLLTRTPRPYLPVEIPTLDPDASGAFRVFALTPTDEDEARDVSRDALPEMRHSVYQAELVWRSLYDERGRCFRNRDELLEFDEYDYSRIALPCLEALAVVAPTYWRADGAAWVQRLALGATVAENVHRACALAWCIDWTDRARVPRPDRYFGVPAGLLTDGQWMAWRAAKQVVIDARQED